MWKHWLGLGLVVTAIAGQAACGVESADGAADETPGATTATGTSGTSGTTKGPHRARGTAGDGYGSTESGGVDPATLNGAGGDAPSVPRTPEACLAAQKELSSQHVFYESADDSNSMGSPALARELLRAKEAPDPATIRTYEFLNYYRIRHAAPAAGHVGIYADAEALDDLQVSLQVGVRAIDAPKIRRPMTLTLVLDSSGSMAGVGLARERALLRALAQKLQAGDKLSVLTWNVDRTVLLSGHAVTGPNDKLVLDTADALRAEGGSDLHTGLVEAYSVARQHYGKDRLNRVVLVSDGGANLGVTDSDLIANAAHDADLEGIYLAGVGTGPGRGYDDALMNAVTDAGRGAYVYLDSVDEAKRMFVDRFDEILAVAAREVKLELTVPYYFDIPTFYGEDISNDPAAIEPQHLAPGGEMIFNQLLQRCAASFPYTPITGDALVARVTWKDPITRAEHLDEQTFYVDTLMTGDHAALHKGQAIVAYAEALKLSGKEARPALRNALQTVKEHLATKELASDPELTEIATLIPMHPSF